MEFNSQEVELPMNFYLGSLGEEVGGELEDSEGRLTETQSPPDQ